MLSPGASAQPLCVAELAGALDRLTCFESAPFVAVAVSGGPDSLALAILADRWARSRRGEVCALSVDHRLRPESGAEIRRLGDWLSARKIRHEVLVWGGKSRRPEFRRRRGRPAIDCSPNGAASMAACIC